MNSETAGGLLFIAGMGAGPLALACYIAGLTSAIFARSFLAPALCHAAGGLLLCSFLWYQHFLGMALGHKVGPFVRVPWSSFIFPWPAAVTATLLLVSLIILAVREKKTGSISD